MLNMERDSFWDEIDNALPEDDFPEMTIRSTGILGTPEISYTNCVAKLDTPPPMQDTEVISRTRASGTEPATPSS